MTKAQTLYDEDFVAWTEQQAQALRAAGRSRTNRILDWENLAEEIESLGKSDRRTLNSQIYRIVRHLAKLQFSPAKNPRLGWRDSVGDGRAEAELVLDDSPSLRRELDRIVLAQTPKAIARAIRDLSEFSEIGPAMQQAMRNTRYSIDEVFKDWFPPEPS